MNNTCAFCSSQCGVQYIKILFNTGDGKFKQERRANYLITTKWLENMKSHAFCVCNECSARFDKRAFMGGAIGWVLLGIGVVLLILLLKGVFHANIPDDAGFWQFFMPFLYCSVAIFPAWFLLEHYNDCYILRKIPEKGWSFKNWFQDVKRQNINNGKVVKEKTLFGAPVFH
ncbi:MAG: hypothetical protein KKD07_03565 [Candidatus Omnitrophica bacterium]|nr:hypothetical protein [Candidatus Omnitrophota bacterium]MBU1997246.1 hypothetical protein [Candidatus Omnitrophota bacterium]MBU4333502.1 hypothetical protein [Candidatus Omnitrophota bacterium]